MRGFPKDAGIDSIGLPKLIVKAASGGPPQWPSISRRSIAVSAIMSLTKGPLDVVSEPDRPARSRAIVELARRLHWKMEHLDPSDTDSGWVNLTDREREFYCLCVKAILDDRSLVEKGFKKCEALQRQLGRSETHVLHYQDSRTILRR